MDANSVELFEIPCLEFDLHKKESCHLGIEHAATKESESLLSQCKERTEAKLRKNSPGEGSVMVLRSENSSEEDDNYKRKKADFKF